MTFLAVGAFAGGYSVSANADPLIPASEAISTADEDLPVMSRPRPEYDAIGVPVDGSFLLFPALNVSGNYDNNVYRTLNNTVDDYYFTIAPSARLKSDWGRHMLEVYGGVSDYQYLSQTAEDLVDWNFGADGRYDIAGGESIYAAASVSELHELLSSVNVVGGQKSPQRYYDNHGELDTTIQPNRLGVTASLVIDRDVYLRTPLYPSGFQQNGDRNFDEYQANLKTFYDFSPGYSGFLRAAFDERQFDERIDRTGVRRASEGYRVDGGLDLQLTRLISGEFYIGYLDQTFKAPLKNVSGLDYSVRLDWLIDPLLTLHLSGARTLNQIILPGVSVSDDKSVDISADYELRRNVILQAHANYDDISYPGINRHDGNPDLGAGIKWLINRNLSASLTYDYTSRVTNIAGADFQDSLVMLGVNLHE
jgi:hypothetical protein